MPTAQSSVAIETTLARTAPRAIDPARARDADRTPIASAHTLTQIALDDLISSFGCQLHPRLTWILRRAFAAPARTFARQMVEFDADVARLGLPDAARRTQRHYIDRVAVTSEAPLPSGPVLALANHPGMADTLSLFSALNREDLKIIALDRPFLTALPNTSRQLFLLREDDSRSRAHLVREVSRHLRKGGAALTFPAGQIEPDPDNAADAVSSLDRWTDSVGVFVRMAPDTAVVPVLVRGVLWRTAARHPLLWLKRSREERERLAATLQLLAHVVCRVTPITVHVHLGRPVTAAALGTTDACAIHVAVLAEMRRLHAIRHEPARSSSPFQSPSATSSTPAPRQAADSAVSS